MCLPDKCHMALPHGAVIGMQCVIMVFPGHTYLLFSMLSACTSLVLSRGVLNSTNQLIPYNFLIKTLTKS